MMKKKKGYRLIEESSTSTSGTEPDEEEISLRKSSFLRAIQSDRITVLIGPSETSFQVPQDLLVRWSPPLGEMCRSGFEESQTRIIRLPHVRTSTFEDFIIWMHAYEPKVKFISFASILDLAIFAEIYMVYRLKNQTSDILRTELGSGRWQFTPETASMVYDEVPPGSILRQLFSLSFALPTWNFPSGNYYDHEIILESPELASTHRKYDNYLEWQPIFEKHPDFGWDYFRQIQDSNPQDLIKLRRPCQFHDHRDIPGAECENIDKCPYPRGALPTQLHKPNGHQREKIEREEPPSDE